MKKSPRPARHAVACGLCAWLLAVSLAKAESMSYLDNGRIRLGADLSAGGAITYLAESGTNANMINSYDFGRQVQLSLYSGPVPFQPPGTQLQKSWEGLGWNPIQAGDCYRHGSKVIAHENNGRVLRIRCVPMIWPLDNVPSESVFEITYRLAGRTVEVTYRVTNARADLNQYPARDQELPALYTNGRWYKLVTYLGSQPLTGGETTTIVDEHGTKGWPWISFDATEHWAALVDRNGRGLGIFNPDACRFIGGFAGAPKGTGGPSDTQTGYLSPTIEEILDHNITYESHCVLVVGTVKEIRKYALNHVPANRPPVWRFKSDRQHWTYHLATDKGWPIRKELAVASAAPEASMRSPLTFWHAAEARTLWFDAAFETPAREVRVLFEPFSDADRRDWPCWGPEAKRPAKTFVGPVVVPIVGDGKQRHYEADLRRVAGYDGEMVRLKVMLPERGSVRMKAIGFRK